LPKVTPGGEFPACIWAYIKMERLKICFIAQGGKS